MSPMSLHGQSSVTQKQNFHVKRASTPGLEDQSDTEDDSDSTYGGSASLQLKILDELKKVTSRLDVVEHQLAERGQRQRQEGKKDLYKISKVSQSKSDSLKCKKYDNSSDVSDSDDDDCEIPILSTIISSKAIQKHVNRAVADLERSQTVKGKDSVIKSKKGGAVDVVVANNWPHEYILGGVSKQRITFDQLNLTQFVNGFVKGVLDEKSVREKMLYYLCDLMEDANDFSWASAKERGTVDWSNTSRIDRIRRAHAQRNTNGSKQNWAQNQDPHHKPWYYKSLWRTPTTFPGQVQRRGVQLIGPTHLA